MPKGNDSPKWQHESLNTLVKKADIVNYAVDRADFKRCEVRQPKGFFDRWAKKK